MDNIARLDSPVRRHRIPGTSPSLSRADVAQAQQSDGASRLLESSVTEQESIPLSEAQREVDSNRKCEITAEHRPGQGATSLAFAAKDSESITAQLAAAEATIKAQQSVLNDIARDRDQYIATFVAAAERTGWLEAQLEQVAVDRDARAKQVGTIEAELRRLHDLLEATALDRDVHVAELAGTVQRAIELERQLDEARSRGQEDEGRAEEVEHRLEETQEELRRLHDLFETTALDRDAHVAELAGTVQRAIGLERQLDEARERDRENRKRNEDFEHRLEQTQEELRRVRDLFEATTLDRDARVAELTGTVRRAMGLERQLDEARERARYWRGHFEVSEQSLNKLREAAEAQASILRAQLAVSRRVSNMLASAFHANSTEHKPLAAGRGSSLTRWLFSVWRQK